MESMLWKNEEWDLKFHMHFDEREREIRIILNHLVVIHVFPVSVKQKFKEQFITYRCDNDMASSFLYVPERIVRIDSAPNLQTAYFYQSSQ